MVYQSDPSATVFQSWGWIRGWIDAVDRADGFSDYDLGGGDEQYKAIFGALEQYNRNIFVTRGKIMDDIRRRIPQPVKNFARKMLKRT